jgi:tRNA C32,U32 (ribose-2'-O)-methylase TrmJ
MSIRIVLVGTTHPGNIGAVARAMKNMGLSDLALVNFSIMPPLSMRWLKP